MVLGELILVPLPEAVAARVGRYAAALGVQDDFIGIARRYAQGALGLAWVDLRRSGFTDRWTEERMAPLYTSNTMEDPFDEPSRDPELEARWHAFAALPDGTLGREVWRMYQMRRWDAPGSEYGASAFLAQHDFVHVIADYGTHMAGEMEVFAFIGRADPDPMGFSWLATMVGLFETGYVHEQGFFHSNVREHTLQMSGMAHRLADAIRRGKVVQEHFDTDLFTVDYHALASSPPHRGPCHAARPPEGDRGAGGRLAGRPRCRRDVRGAEGVGREAWTSDTEHAQVPENVPPIPDWNRLLDGRVAVVTGGGAGIGGAIARLFAQHGAHVEIAEIDPERADATVADITAAGGSARAHVVDVTDADAGRPRSPRRCSRSTRTCRCWSTTSATSGRWSGSVTPAPSRGRRCTTSTCSTSSRSPAPSSTR